MRTLTRPCLWLLAVLLAFTGSATAQILQFNEGEPVQVLFVLDVSNSMTERWQRESKWEAAVDILSEFTDELDQNDNLQMALRVYGHASDAKKHDCKDSELLVEMSDNTSTDIKGALAKIGPRGITPLSFALKKSLKDFKSDGSKKVLILITDGKESCNQDPCELMPEFYAQNIEIKPILIGEQIPSYFVEDYTCMGDVVLATSPDEFKEDLVGKQKEEEVPVKKGSVQVFLLNEKGNPTETNVNLIFFDAVTGDRVMNIYHSLNFNKQPDLIFLEPGTYHIEVQTTPVVKIQNVEVRSEENTKVTTRSPQGSLIFNIEGPLPRGVGNFNINVIVHQQGEKKTLYNQRNNQSKRYLTGYYDAEILTLPRIILKNIEVKQSTERIENIPSPGILHLIKEVSYKGGIFTSRQDEDKKIYDLKDNPKEMILLQPGDYWIVYRKVGDSLLETRMKKFSINSGNTITIRL